MNHPFLDTSFEIPWSSMTPECVREDIELALKNAGEALDRIRNLGEAEANYGNVFLAMENAGELLSIPWRGVSHLEEVSDGPALREAHNAMLPAVSDFFARIPLDEALWRAVRAAAAKPETQALDPIRRRFVDETVKDFTDEGVELPPDKKERLTQIQSELSSLTQKYSENVLDSTNAYELIVEDPKRLAGLPPHAREAARLDAQKHGQGTDAEPKWRFTLQFPSYGPVMQYLDDDDIRHQLYDAFAKVGRGEKYDNTALVWKILELRHEKAILLGKTNFADITTARRMARTGRAALDFVEDMHDRVYIAFVRECRELEEFKAKETNTTPESLQPWEIAYWMEKLRRAKYDFDEEQLRPYFPISNVINGMFSLFGRLYGFRVEERTGEKKPDVWHPDVRYYDIYNTSDGAWIGSFYADWHPRSTKRSGAWMEGLRYGETKPNGSRAPHLGLVCGNLTEPQGDKPALLTHREVETIFHEFGHLMHHVLSDVPVKYLGGTSVAWDFVEMPSQISENWTWERESLDLFARHYLTGERIPDDIYAKMLAARHFGAARASMRQLSFGKMDLELHLNYERYKGRDLDKTITEILDGYLTRTKTPVQNNVRSFGHLFSSSTGYAAGYYSYKWAEVLEADAFTRFKNEGVLNEKTGSELRGKILSQGNSRPPEELFRDFMGRDPDPDALLVREGILEK